MERSIKPKELAALFIVLRRAVWEAVVLLGVDLGSASRIDAAAQAYRGMLQDLKDLNFRVTSYARNNSNAVVAWEARTEEWTINYRRLIPAVSRAIESVKEAGEDAA